MNIYKHAIITTILMLVLSANFAQDDPIPEFYGVYMVLDDRLIELNEANKSNITGLKFTISYSCVGIKEVGTNEWLKSNNIYFIVYGDQVNNQFYLSEMRFKNTIQRPADAMERVGHESMTHVNAEVNMNMVSKNINLRKAPVKGLENAVKYVPSEPITEGAFAFHDGVLNITKTSETTSDILKRPCWDFIYSVKFSPDKPIQDLNFSKGEYTVPNDYGIWIVDKSQGLVELSQTKFLDVIPYYFDEEFKVNRLQGLTTSGNGQAIKEKAFSRANTVSSANMANYLLVLNENVVGRGSGTIEIVGESIAPDAVYLSKLKTIEIDKRSKGGLKKNKPPKIDVVWVEDLNIPIVDINQSWYSPLLFVLSFENALAPGRYALHNGGINDQPRTWGIMPKVFYFEVQ